MGDLVGDLGQFFVLLDLAHLNNGRDALLGDDLVEVGNAVDINGAAPLFVLLEDLLQMPLLVKRGESHLPVAPLRELKHQPGGIGNQPEMLQHSGGWCQHFVPEVAEFPARKQHDARRVAVTQQVEFVELAVGFEHPVGLDKTDLPPL